MIDIHLKIKTVVGKIDVRAFYTINLQQIFASVVKIKETGWGHGW